MRLVKVCAAGALAAIALGGCGLDKVEDRARQLNVIGDVEITSVFCTSGDMNADVHSCAPYERPHRGQALVAYRIPDGSDAPPDLTDNGNSRHFTRSDSYTAYMEEEYADEGMHWAGYVSGVTVTAPGYRAAFTLSPRFPLPDAGKPFTGPFRYSVTGGFRELMDDADGSAPVDCRDDVNAFCTSAGVPGEDSTAATRDLALLPSADVPTVAPGGHVDVPFDVRLAGEGGASFGWSATTDLDGATVSVEQQAIEAGANPVDVAVEVPAGTPLGTYEVQLSATASGDPDVIINRQAVASGAQAGGTEQRTGAMTFRVVAPPPDEPASSEPPQSRVDEPAPAAGTPLPVAAPPLPVPATPAAQRTPRAKLRLSLTPLPRRAHSGDYVSYLLVARNAARQAARRTRVCETLPGRVQFVQASRPARFHGRDLCFDRGRLAGGDSLAAVIYVHVDTDAPAGMARASAVATASNAGRARARAGLRVLRRAAAPQRAPVTG